MPDSQRQVRRGIKQVRIDGFQAARPKPLVITSSEPELVYLAQINVGAAFEDETKSVPSWPVARYRSLFSRLDD